MKTVDIEQATLEACVRQAQGEHVVLTRNGLPVALLVGVEGLDEEKLHLGSSDDFWRLIVERRRHKTLTRAELERKSSKTD